jgi:phosphoribosyl-ATP pyrophosphohydrolase/phosphoribosyl-AMP cyclohydrolase
MRPGAALTREDVDQLDFGKGAGLIPAIVQDSSSGAVLMLAYMNREALIETLSRKRVVFFSRSKQRLWEKGATSGNTLELTEVRSDCDGDALLVTARPRGPACHLGLATCFGDASATMAEPLAFLSALEGIIDQRLTEKPEASYTAKLHAQGIRRVAQKVGEEGVEFALAATSESDEKVTAEAADLLFHLLLGLKSRALTLHGVVAELQRRHAASRS